METRVACRILATGLSMAIKVSIIEDDDWIRENLATQIAGTSGFSCLGSFRNGEEAVAQIPRERRM